MPLTLNLTVPPCDLKSAFDGGHLKSAFDLEFGRVPPSHLKSAFDGEFDKSPSVRSEECL